MDILFPLRLANGLIINSGRNNDLYEQDITKDLLPFVEQKFHVRNDAAGRSIVGLSMGGGYAWTPV